MYFCFTEIRDIPSTCIPQQILEYALNVNFSSLRKSLWLYHDECYAQGKRIPGLVAYTIGAVINGIESIHVTLVPAEDCYEFILNMKFVDGCVEEIHTDIFYNPETGDFFGYDEKGMWSIGYDFNLEDMLVKATLNGWMRSFGFCLEYDIFSYTTPFFFYHTRRFKFDYAGKEWMIQIWKGNYVISNGSEVGVYNREKGSFGSFYNCVDNEDMLDMTLALYHGDEVIYELGQKTHWWANAFKLTKDLYTADEMTMKFSLVMKDAEMLKAFTEAVDRNAYHDVSYMVNGLTVYLEW